VPELALSDKYRREQGTIFLTGVEAIVRLLLDKQRSDRDAGRSINQSYVTGYEGSPLGGLDLRIIEQLDLLNELGRTVHQSGINEKTAASAMLGSQYAPSGDVDAFWYGKAHGTMWIPDEAWLANLTGTSRTGSMVLLCGEDHRSKSSVSPGSSDWALRASWVPIFYPATVEDVLLLGAHAVALSRWLGVVTSMKLVTPVCDGGATLPADAARIDPQFPDPDYVKRFHPIVMALGALPMQRELVERKAPLVEEYVYLNGLNRSHWLDSGGTTGIVATGKSFVDVTQALQLLGVRVPVFQMSVTWPIDGRGLRRFAADSGVQTIIVVEEPGPFVEDGVKAALWGTAVREILGERDAEGAPLVPSWGEVDPEVLARILAPRLKPSVPATGLQALARIDTIEARALPSVPRVVPMSCGGCPYNAFRALDGEKPGGAIGCSSIRAMEAYDTGVLYIPTMGAGGSIYSGTAPFNDNAHIFQYLGDGSYFHSGRGAVQSCVQGEVNITFLLLYNGAVALTGGQQPGGQRSVAEVTAELLALGVVEVGIVGDEQETYDDVVTDGRVRWFPLSGHADAIEHFRQLPGTTVLILDKECATEKGRRRRRQGKSPERYVFIDEDICEGCGDCLRKSEGCAALYAVDTELGDKTQVRQAHCMQDELCLEGDCPAFLTVTASGASLRRRHPHPLDALPEPPRHKLSDGEVFTLLALGRGGTGVVTVSHIIAYAAQLDGLSVSLSNNTGLAQKGGPVEAPIQLARGLQPAFHRLLPGSVDLYLGFDLLRAAEPTNLRYASAQTHAVVSTTRVPTADINRNPDLRFPDPDGLARAIDDCTANSDNVYLDSYWLAERLFGDILFANMVMLGAAYQAGHLPLSGDSLESVIRLNGKAVDDNLQAFRWGRLAVADPERLQNLLGSPEPDAADVVAAARQRLAAGTTASEAVQLHDDSLREMQLSPDGERVVSYRIAELVAWQDTGWARRYVALLQQVRGAELAHHGGEALTLAVARGLHRLMSYKDEYEVARLATRGAGIERVQDLFDGPVQVAHNLHPPILRPFGVGKIRMGAWLRPLLSVLYRCRGLRSTRWDPFGQSSCRRLERELIDWYEGVVTRLVAGIKADATAEQLLPIAAAVDGLRGFEEVKEASAHRVRTEVAAAFARLESAGKSGS
jgi:indolepyruvate ferredoxin oxidoreductase